MGAIAIRLGAIGFLNKEKEKEKKAPGKFLDDSVAHLNLQPQSFCFQLLQMSFNADHM